MSPNGRRAPAHTDGEAPGTVPGSWSLVSGSNQEPRTRNQRPETPGPRWSLRRTLALGLLLGLLCGALGVGTGQYALAALVGLAAGLAVGRYAGRRHG